MQIARMYTGPDGITRMEELSEAELKLPAKELVLRRKRANLNGQWHTAGRRQLAIVQSGRVNIETADGTIREFGPGDLILEEDLTGKGHRAWSTSPEPVILSAVMLDQ